MSTIYINDVPINLHTGSIGLSLSGGADSTLLAYILMKNINSDIHFCTICSKEKGYTTAFHTHQIIKKLCELSNKHNVYHHIKYVEQQTRTNLLSYLAYSIKTHALDIMYTATTSVPEQKILDSFKSKLPADILQRRSLSLKKQEYSTDRTIYSPFMNYDKKKINDLYSYLGIVDNLYSLTRSCESTITLDEHCGNCWWCEERLWAFGKY